MSTNTYPTQSLPSNVPLPLSVDSELLTAATPSPSDHSHPYAASTLPTPSPTRSSTTPSTVTFYSRPSSSLFRNGNATAPSSGSSTSKKAHENTKAQKIKEYLGIACKISDWDFEALQNDIQELGQSLLEDTKHPVPECFKINFLEASKNNGRSLLEAKTKSASLSVTSSSLGSQTQTIHNIPLANEDMAALGSETESEGEEVIPTVTSEEFRLLRNYEEDSYLLSWRWSWLQLQVQEVRRNVLQSNDYLMKLREEKKDLQVDVSLENSCSRCVGWKPLSKHRLLLPPTSRSLHLRKKRAHPLFAQEPRLVRLPGIPRPVVSSPGYFEELEPKSPRKKTTPRRDRSRRNRSVSERRRTSTPRKSADFDIDNVVLPASAQKIRLIEYKEIMTPTFRVLEDMDMVLFPDEEGDSEEDTDEELYKEKHTRMELEEKKKFAVPIPAHKLKRVERKKRTQNRRSLSTPTLPPAPIEPIEPIEIADTPQMNSPFPASRDYSPIHKRVRTPSRKQKEMELSHSMPSVRFSLRTSQRKKKRSGSRSSIKTRASRKAMSTPSVNHRYPKSMYVSSVTPSNTAIQSPPTHFHNTRRSALATSIFGENDMEGPGSASLSKKKRRKNKKKDEEEVEENDNSTKIYLRIAQDMISTPTEPDAPAEEEDEDEDAPLKFVFTTNEDGNVIGKKRKKKKKKKKKKKYSWTAAKRVCQDPTDITSSSNVIILKKCL